MGRAVGHPSQRDQEETNLKKRSFSQYLKNPAILEKPRQAGKTPPGWKNPATLEKRCHAATVCDA
jgi:hypothetical protein